MPLPMVPPPITPAIFMSMDFPKKKQHLPRRHRATENSELVIHDLCFVFCVLKSQSKANAFQLPTYPITKFSDRTRLSSSPQSREGPTLFLKRERCLDSGDLDNVTFLQLLLTGKVFTVDLDLAFFVGSGDEVFIVVLADEGSRLRRKKSFEADRRHIGLANHRHLARQDILLLVGPTLKHVQDSEPLLGRSWGGRGFGKTKRT